MTSQRKAIRDAFREVIVAAATDLGERVFENRVRPFRHKQLPAASIFTRSESVEINSEGPRLYVRACEVIVDVVIDGEAEVDDRADLLCDDVEDALERSDLLDRVADLARFELVRVEGPTLFKEGTRILGGVSLVYIATYEDEITDQPEDLTDLRSIHTEVDSAPGRAGPELEDHLELQPTTP